MSETRSTVIYEVRVENGPALSAFEQLVKKLNDVRFAKANANKLDKEIIKAETEVATAIKLQGVASAEQVKVLASLNLQRDANNRKLAEAILNERNYSSQIRESSNDLSGLTERGERFRDKMAQATLEAIRQSGVLNQLGARSASLDEEVKQVNTTLEKNVAQLGELRVAYEKGATSEEEYARQSADLNKAIADGQKAQEKLGNELEQVKQKAGKLETELAQLEKQYRAGKLSLDEYRAATQRLEDSVGGLSGKFDAFVAGQGKELKSTLGSMAVQYAGVGAAIYGAVQIISDAGKTIVDFNKGLAGVSALGGEYKANIDALGEAAKGIGVKFGIGSEQSLSAIEALAKAGVSATDILGGGLEGALTLAASGSLDVGEAAEFAASAMNQFGLNGKDVPRIADLLSAAANKAAGEVSDFGNALKFVGPVAAGLNVPLEDTVGTLALFAQNGIAGEQAGTSLRGVLSALTSPSKVAADEMERLGIVTADGSSKLFDAQGNFRGLANLAEQLQTSTKDLTQEERAAALGRIFGNQQLTAAQILYKGGGTAVNEYTNAINVSGFAAQVAGEKTNSLSGSTDRAKAAWGEFVLSLEDGNGRIAKAIRMTIDGFTSLFQLLSGGDQTEKDISAFTGRVQKQFEALGGTGQLAAEDGDALVKMFRIRSQAVVSYGNTLQDIETIEAARNLTIEQTAALSEKELASRRSGGEALTELERVQLAAGNAAIEVLSDEIVKRKEATSATAVAAETADAAARKEAAGVETIAQARERLNAELTAAKDARGAIAATDTVALAANKALTDGLTAQISALDGNTTSTKAAAKAKSELVQQQEALAKQLAQDANQRTVDALPGQDGALLSLDQERAAREAVAKGNAELLLAIEVDYQARRTIIIEQAAQERQAVQDQAEAGLVQSIAAGREQQLRTLEEQQAADFELAVLRGEDLNALAARQAEERKAITDPIRRQQEDDLTTKFEQDYAALDGNLIAQFDRQTKYETDLANLRAGFRTQELVDKQASDRAILQAEQEKAALMVGLAQQASQLFGAALFGQEKDLKAFGKNMLTLLLKTAKQAIQIEIAKAQAISLAAPDSVATFGASGVVRGAILTGLIEGVFAGLQSVVQGFATGGIVGDNWGPRVNRSNGDNVLVRTDRGGLATLRTGEAVLNEEQQRRVKRKTGVDIRHLAELPGYSRERVDELHRQLRDADAGLRLDRLHGFALGGIADFGSIRPDPGTIVNNVISGELKEASDRPIFARFTEFKDMEARDRAITLLSSNE